jgi:Uma2 family endonuclease
MSTDTALISVEEFWEMDFDGPVELVRGEIVEMTRPKPRHGFVCTKVSRYLDEWADEQNAGFVVSNDSGVLTERDPDTLRGPDVYFIRHERLPEGRLPDRWLEIAPDLAVEVFSPGDRWKDVWEKIHEYFALGVGEVWVIEPEKRQVHVIRPDAGPLVVEETGTLQSPELLPGFACPVANLLPPPNANPQEGL